MIIIIATNRPIALDHDFQNALKAANASETHTAIINIWTIEIVNGQMLNVIPASNPLLIFLGYTTFIAINDEQVKTNTDNNTTTYIIFSLQASSLKLFIKKHVLRSKKNCGHTADNKNNEIIEITS